MPSSRPLWIVSEETYGLNSMGEGYTRPFSSFYRLALVLDPPTHLAPPIEQNTAISLTISQVRSFWILWDWWNTYQEACQVPQDSPPSDFQVHLVAGLSYKLHVESLHFMHVLALFEREFSGIEGAFDEAALESRREETAVQHACYHIALECYRSVVEAKSWASKLRPIDSSLLLAPKYKGVFEGGRRIIQNHELCGLDPRCSTGASIISCPWLTECSGMPFFLWDVVNMEVVEVSTLSSHVEYTAISHTWGRWQKEVPVSVPGVKGWLVPQNSIFDVLDLPSILALIPTTTPYVWFDLVCIPQDHSMRAQDEISRQAEIFKQAKHTIAWFNLLDSWEGLKLAIEWMSLIYLNVDNSNDKDNRQDVATGLFNDYTYEEGVPRHSMEVIGWFSSLWTLQEICLRPDMWLCDKEWTLLQVGDGMPVAFNSVVALTQECCQILQERVSLEGLARDYVGMSSKPQFNLTTELLDPAQKFGLLIQYDQYQRGFLELVELFDRTGMKDLHMIKRETIMLLGSQRFCQDSRAEAIMSVLGVREWKTSELQIVKQFSADNLVLGQYPLKFVQDVAKQLGAAFFNSLSVSFTDLNLLGTPRGEQKLPKGTLLPFIHRVGPVFEDKFLLNWVFLEEKENPIVRAWEIQVTGSVIIREAAIIASSTDSDKTEIICNIWLTHDAPDDDDDPRFKWVGGGMRRYRTVNLSNWVKRYLPFSNNYAVELLQSNGLSRGVLLKEVRCNSGVLVKIGNYITSNNPNARNPNLEHSPGHVRAVDWIVL